MCRLIVSEIVTSPCMTTRVERIGEKELKLSGTLKCNGNSEHQIVAQLMLVLFSPYTILAALEPLWCTLYGHVPQCRHTHIHIHILTDYLLIYNKIVTLKRKCMDFYYIYKPDFIFLYMTRGTKKT